MLTDVVQRWRDGRAAYRPAGEPLDPRRYEVAPIAGDTEAKDFILRHHYAGTYPAARRRFGLYRAGALVGVAVYSVPVNERAVAGLPGEPEARIELGRFVLTDAEPANSESWFLARTFELLRADGFASVLSMSDPVPRSREDGTRVFPGHIGTIYQSTNAVYAGRATARTLRLLPDGTVLSPRGLQKIRAGERGWRAAAARLEAFGADAPALDDACRRAWLRHWIERLTRPLKHAGNHRYLWALHRRDRRYLPASLPYPKWTPAVSGLPSAAAVGA